VGDEALEVDIVSVGEEETRMLALDLRDGDSGINGALEYCGGFGFGVLISSRLGEVASVEVDIEFGHKGFATPIVGNLAGSRTAI
jgi:hypothetical protein